MNPVYSMSIVSAFALVLSSANFQAQTPPATAAPPAFEVASVKPAKASGQVQEACHGIDSKFGANDPRKGVPLGRCVISSGRLSHMIGLAYGVSMDMIKGGPDWVTKGDHRFDVEAEAEDPAKATEQQLLEMLQTLLSDRFKLTFHREKREVQGFALVTAKNGAKLKEAASDESTRIDWKISSVPFVSGSSEPGSSVNAVNAGRERGGRGPRMITLAATRVSMQDLIRALRPLVRAPLVDETGFKGYYDFTLNWEAGQTLSDPLQEQLGLNLASQKVPIDFFIIDSAEEPPPN
jgi:uncharacterized protein (TIGR03435 family)